MDTQLPAFCKATSGISPFLLRYLAVTACGDGAAAREVGTMLEKDITNAILRYLKTVPDCFCWKQHGGQYGTAGLPDIICCINGKFVALEVKIPSGKLTKLQNYTIERIQSANGKAFKVTTLQEVKEIIQNLNS
jgi:hypothetical protein